MTHIDHIADAFALQLEQDKDDPRFQALLGAIASKMDEIGTVLDDLQVMLALDRPIPSFLLDHVGKLLGIPRSVDWTDETYRVWLRARQAARQSSGTYPEVLLVAYLCRRLGGSEVVVHRVLPKAYQIEIPHISAEDVEIVKSLLQSAVTTTTQVKVVNANPGTGFYFDNATNGLNLGLLQEIV